MPTPGLLVVFSKPKPGWDEKKFNEWYSEHHLDHVNDAGISDLAVRYKNIDPNAKWPYLALYRLPDVANLADEKRVNSVAADHDLIPNGGPWIDNIDMDRRAYVTIQKFEGQIEKKGARGKAIITVTMEPGDDADFDDWYRKQHLDMLSMVPGYRRSTRHKLADEKNEDGHPRFLACHEYDTKEIPGEFVKLCVGTEWSKKIIGEAKHFGRDVWEQIAEKGAVESKL